MSMGCGSARVARVALAGLVTAACGGGGGGSTDAGGGGDGPRGDGSGGPLGYVDVAAGWTVGVAHDFSADHVYNPAELVDGAVTHGNEPEGLFFARAPYPEALLVIAGRQLLELGAGGSYTVRDFTHDMPDQPDLPDAMRVGTWVPDFLSAGPTILVSSSSENAGDGVFQISTSWVSARDRNVNNTRAILWDATGAFDDVGGPEGYLGTQYGLIRRSASPTVLIPGDHQTMHLVGPNLLVSRRLSTTSFGLVLIASGAHTETMLAERGELRIGEGDPPPPFLAWVVIDRRQLALVDPSGELVVIGETQDPGYTWRFAAAPPDEHPFAGPTPRVYVIENNRTLDIDRVLVFTGP
jgi:hypothetical protein